MKKAYAFVHVKALKRWVVLFLAYCLLLAMSTSWTIDDLKKEMDDVVKLVQQKQKSLKDGTDTTAFQKRLCAGVICKLEQINDMTVGKALELYQHVDAINMTDDMKNMIKAKLDDVLENDNRSPQRPDGLTFTVKPQYINLPAYLTASDWDLLKTSSSYHAKIRCICCRLKSLGLVSLAEKSVGSAVATLLSSLTVVPEASIIHKLVQDVKLSFMSTPQCHATPLKYINTYPEDPTLLGDEFLLKSYKESKPMLHKPEEYQSLLRVVPLRSTSKMLSKGRSSDALATSSTQGGIADQSQSGTYGSNMSHGMQNMNCMQGMNGMQNMNGMMQFASMASMMNYWMNSQKHTQEVPHQPPQPAPRKDEALALTDGVASKATPETLPICDESKKVAASSFQPKLRSHSKSDSSLDQPEEECKEQDAAEEACAEAEKAAFQALKNRNTKGKKQEPKKESTAVKSKGKGKQGKGKGLKRPAACISKSGDKFEYECPSPDSTWDTRNKESWKSKHYHSAREQALKCGKTKEDALACGRAAHKKAAEKWYKKYNE